MTVLEPVLHGREYALDTLRDALEGALGGRGRLALVLGEAGIGKSALAAAIARDAEARGAVVTWGRAWEFADAPPYFPVWPCLRALGIETTGDAFQLWERVVESLARTSAKTPAVWVLEDLHAADLGTLDLLTFLAQPLQAMRVLVLATVRTQDPRLNDRVQQRMTRMGRDGFELSLSALSDREVAAVTQDIMGRPVPESAVARLVALTGGNPLFVVECARAFRAAGGVEGTLGSLPPSVRQVVLDRFGLLTAATREALTSGAVLGREFAAAPVARMLDTLPARVIDVLLPALRSGLVIENKPGQFVFSHVLVRDAIDDALDPSVRAELHSRAAAALAPLGDTAEILVERARHALAALPSGDARQAIALAERATELLESAGAADRAFELSSRLAEARGAGFLPPAPASERLRHATLARTAGRSDVSRRECEEVAAAARANGDAELFAQAVLLHAADVRPGVIDREELALLEEARSLLGLRAPALGARVLARLATALQPAPDQSVLMEMSREAIRVAHETRDEAAILDVLELARWGLYCAPLSERVAAAAELRDRAVALNDLPKALGAHASLAFYNLESADFDAFAQNVESALVLSDEVGHPRHRWRALLLASMRAVTLGHFAESDRYLTEVAHLAALIDDQAFAFSVGLHDIMRGRLQRRDDEVRRASSDLSELMGEVANAPLYIALIRATCAARMEDVEATRMALATIGSRAAMFQTDFADMGMLAEAYALAGSDAERRQIREALARSGRIEMSGDQVSFTYEGTVVRLLGLLDAALGDLSAAERELGEAHALASRRGHLPWVAQTAYELAHVLERAGRREDAVRFREESARLAGELGMTGLSKSLSTYVAPVANAPHARIGKKAGGFEVSRGQRAVSVKDSRGMQLLAKLVERPDQEIHVLTLVSEEPVSLAESNAGEMIDERARAEYRERLGDLEQELSDAERDADGARLERLRREKEALVAELGRAFGLGGRPRRAASATERARINVQRRLKDALARIAEADAELGRYFERAVRTGTYCCFRH